MAYLTLDKMWLKALSKVIQWLILGKAFKKRSKTLFKKKQAKAIISFIGYHSVFTKTEAKENKKPSVCIPLSTKYLAFLFSSIYMSFSEIMRG